MMHMSLISIIGLWEFSLLVLVVTADAMAQAQVECGFKHRTFTGM